MYIATNTQMKKYDMRLIEEGYSIESLVDKASDCLLTHCLSYDNISVFCGTGNNGADGISLAVKLHKQNRKVTIYLVGDFSKASSACLYYLQEAKKDGIKIISVTEALLKEIDGILNYSELIIDAIFGFGLHSNPRGLAGDIISHINKAEGIDIIAVDIPTGLQCNTGTPYENTVRANKTISLTAYKQGFLNPASKKYTGEVTVELLKTKDFRANQGFAELLNKDWINSQLKARDYYGHKGTYGKMLHIAGSDNYKGAALLSAKASVYSGSGIVTVSSNEKVLTALTSYLPEAISIKREDTFEDIKNGSYDAVLVGPGLGLTKDAENYVKELLGTSSIPLVIDADALTITAKNKELLKNYRNPVILTPHLGEFKRFIPDIDEDDIVDTARMFAKEYNSILILKGPNSLITDGKNTFRNISGNPAMSIAGSGDVLSGIVSSLLGQGYAPLTAALLAVYIHGKCGDNLAKENYTTVSSELIKEIPKVMHEMKSC